MHKIAQNCTKFLILFLFFSSCQKESKPVVELNQQIELRTPCPSIDYTGCEPKIKTTTFNYEMCQITSTATFYICNNEVKMVMNSNTPPWSYANTPECKKLKKKMSDNYLTPYVGDQLAVNLYNDIHKKTIDALQSSFLEGGAKQGFATVWPCNQFYEPGICQAGNGNNVISLVLSDCIRLCPAGTDDDGNVNLSVVKCGTSCCKRENRFCYDETNGSICQGNSIITSLGPCDLIPTNCTTPSNNCSPPCDRL